MKMDVTELEYGAVQGALAQVHKQATGFSCIGNKVYLSTEERHDDEIEWEGLAGGRLPAILF